MSPPTRMHAARLHRVRSDDEPEVVSIDEVAVPPPGQGEVLVRIAACGICASDLHVVDGTTLSGPTPLILGHEAAGVVETAGEGVTAWSPGDRVALLMGRACGACSACGAGRESLCERLEIPGIDRDGVQAEYAVARDRDLVAVPDGIPLEQAAILTDAVATPYHAIRRAGLEPGMSCAIYGLGGLGMHAVLLARALGASWIAGVDLDPINLERALAWGADEVIDAGDGKPAREVRARSDGGVDRAFEFVGSPASQSQAVKSLHPGGRATIVGLTPRPLDLLPAALLVSQELEVIGSFGSSRSDLEELLSMVERGDLDLGRSITHRWTLEDFPEGLRALETREGHPIRSVVTRAEP
ncbi:MAG TPA: zinc-binding dehydrogenase [Actinomycetota bacterium]|nr:zinc-binding dehydrogenase [Actinomycetota bacterium]